MDPRRPQRTVGHRGASALAPENSLLAVERAIQHALELVEVDVHLSRDGELVVVHDAEVTVGGRAVAVSELAAADLAAIPLGLGQGIPRLSEVLALARGRIGVYVELKGARTGSALGRLVAAGVTEGVEVISGSFEPALVGELRAAAPAVPRTVLFRQAPAAEMIGTCAALGATYAHPCFRPLTPAIVEALHGAGLLVMAPHTNDRDEARAFAALGIDVLASDDPRVLSSLHVT